MEPKTLMAMTPEDVHNYLEHHGIKGMRWGVRRTPEELGHILKSKNARHYGKYNKAVAKIGKIQGDKTVSQLSTKEKKKMADAIEKAQAHLKKMASNEEKYGKKISKAETREQVAKEKEAAKEASKAAEDQKLKEKLLKKQKWEDIYNNKDLFTTQELSDVATRINAEKRVQDALESNQMDKFTKKINSAANLVGSGVNLYNKVKDVQNIFESGQREKAYKEIRKLMAEGNNAEVIKKSVGIADGDVEKFTKRATFLREMNKGLGIEYKGGSSGSTNSGSTKKEKSLLDNVLDKTINRNKKTFGDAMFEKDANKLMDQFFDTWDKSSKKTRRKQMVDQLSGDLFSSKDASASVDILSTKINPILQSTTNSPGYNQFKQDHPLSKVEALRDLTLNKVGDYTFNDYFPSYPMI